MKVKASLKNYRVSPRKVRSVISVVKGMGVDEALVQLNSQVQKSSRQLEKLMKSAVANAENNFNLSKDDLFVSDIQVGEGPILKRWMPRAHGRATAIMKRTSHIFLTLETKREPVAEVEQEEKGSKVKEGDAEPTESEVAKKAVKAKDAKEKR